ETFDRRRIPDDRQAIAVTDQLNFVIHRPLLKRGQGEPKAPAKDGRGLSSPLRSSSPGPVSAQPVAAGQMSSSKIVVQLLIFRSGSGGSRGCSLVLTALKRGNHDQCW